MEEKQYFVYILANYTHTTFYIGVTSNLQKRMYEPSNKLFEGFTAKYNINQLLYYEIYNEIELAIQREKKLKKWKKQWKWNLIDKINNERKNLYIQGNILPVDNSINK